MKPITFTDARVDPDQFVCLAKPDWIFLEGSTLADHWDTGWNSFEGWCPVCDGHPRNREYCLRCDRAGLDGEIAYPGLPIGYAQLAAWPPTDGQPIEPPKPKRTRPAEHPTTPESLDKGKIELPPPKLRKQSRDR